MNDVEKEALDEFILCFYQKMKEAFPELQFLWDEYINKIKETQK